MRFEVTPETGRTWRVFAADTVVEVVGTVFVVEVSASRVQVLVERGVVDVRSPRLTGRLARLRAGDQVTVADVEPPSPPAVLLVPPPSGASPPRRAVRATPPELVADAGAQSEAAAPQPAPPEHPAVDTGIAEQLLRDADALRAAGRDSEAMAALESVVNTSPRSPEAALAAYTLARMHHEQHSAALASQWYARALSLGLGEPLRSVALQALSEAR